MTGRLLRPVYLGLFLTVGLLASAAPASAQDDDAYDVVIEIDDQSVTYNGESVDGLAILEEDLAGDIEADPELTVKVLARDTVPAEYIVQIMEMIRQYEVSCSLEMVSSRPGHDDNM